MAKEPKETALLQEPAKPEVKLEVVEQAGGVYQGYANHILASFTGHDVILRFNQLARLPEYTPSDKPTSRLEQRAAITLAWSEAKALRDLLTALIQSFETTNETAINPVPKVP
jgi:hypothetical protein